MTNTVNEINTKTTKTIETTGNMWLFESPPEFAIAHCESADFKMGTGILQGIRDIYLSTRSKLKTINRKRETL